VNPTVENVPLDMNMDPFLGLEEGIESSENPLGNILDEEPMNSAVFDFLKDYPDDQAKDEEDFEYPDPTNYEF
jgi:ferritin